MNNYTEIKKCRCCESDVKLLLDLNDQPLANSYHDGSSSLEEFPLKLNVCTKCFHLQLSVVVEPDLMFKNYLYVSGTTNTLKEYFDFFAKFTIERFKNYFNRRPESILDIACNDGTQLNYYKKQGLSTFGIDPAENLVDELNGEHDMICDYFPSKRIDRKYSLITAQNVFAHTHDIFTFLKSCSDIIDDEGIIYIQTSQANMVLNNEFDTTYHEHLSFFNSLSMKTIVERSGLKLNNVFKFDIHGTSYIFEISKSKYDSNIDSILKIEKERGLYDITTYERFEKNARKISLDLKYKVDEYKSQGYKVIGYGAAAKGMTLLNFAKIDLDYIIDDNPLKQNLLTPGRNIIIKPSSLLRTFSDEEKIVFIPLAWNFFDEINKRIKNERNNENDIFMRYFPQLQIIKNTQNEETPSFIC
jgi:2-polyprenyl-3-methyl-5-hydroxy-6-metoxy-1,4-benzoquinol methylase